MSVYKPKNKPFYLYDFQYRGTRFHGSTGTANRKEAERFERSEKERAKRGQHEIETSGLTVKAAIAVYYHDKGQYEKNAGTSWTWFEAIADFLGPNKAVEDVTDRDLQMLIASRRANVSNATVNRSVTQLLHRVWAHNRVKTEINWKKLMLPEPRERVRELYASEERAIMDAIRPDGRGIFKWAIATGMRRDECLNLKWANIDYDAAVVHIKGKGDKWRQIPLTREMISILAGEKHNPVYVFTYVQQRASHGRRRGTRHRLTKTVLRMIFHNALEQSGVTNLRWHDLRHTFATRYLRSCGNPALVQKWLGHDDIATTMKYAHSDVEDLRASMESEIPDRSGVEAVSGGRKSK